VFRARVVCSARGAPQHLSVALAPLAHSAQWGRPRVCRAHRARTAMALPKPHFYWVHAPQILAGTCTACPGSCGRACRGERRVAGCHRSSISAGGSPIMRFAAPLPEVRHPPCAELTGRQDGRMVPPRRASGSRLIPPSRAAVLHSAVVRVHCDAHIASLTFPHACRVRYGIWPRQY
jgi:hypothetical protein